MRRIFVLWIVIVICAGFMPACRGEKDFGQPESNISTGDIREQYPEQSADNDESRDNQFIGGVTLPEDAIIEHQKTFDVDTNGNPDDYRYRWQNDDD